MHLYSSQPGAEYSLMPRVALYPWEVHFNNSTMTAMGLTILIRAPIEK